MITTEVLPTIGDGVLMPAAVGDVDAGHPGVEVVAASAVGTLYVLGTDGKSVYGTDRGRRRARGVERRHRLAAGRRLRRGAQLAGHRGVARSRSPDRRSVTCPATSAKEPAAPTVGLSRLLDFNLADLQLPSDDQLTAWNGATGKVLVGFPQTTSDMAFFVTPAIADLDGDGKAEVIAGNGVSTLNAFDADGQQPGRLAEVDRRLDGRNPGGGRLGRRRQGGGRPDPA